MSPNELPTNEENKEQGTVEETVKFDALQTKSLGPQILNAAIEKRQREISDSVVRNAEELLRVKAVAEEDIRRATEQIKDAETKMDKLKAGQFHIVYGGEIIFDK